MYSLGSGFCDQDSVGSDVIQPLRPRCLSDRVDKKVYHVRTFQGGTAAEVASTEDGESVVVALAW